MIELKAISKSFGDRKVLEDISFTFETGKTNLIIGQSGQGKTVCLKSMVGLFHIDEGQVLYDGRDFFAMTDNERKLIRQEIGMLFQGGALFDSQTVLENVMFPLTMFSGLSREEIKERALFCLARVNLRDANDLYPSEISGGMKKRVAIARAIAPKPKYLFCDEPNSGLDPQTSIVIDNLIKEITEEYQITTVVITHDMNSVIEIGDKIMFIHEGKNCWEGDKSSILTTSNPQINDFVYASEFMKVIKKEFNKGN